MSRSVPPRPGRVVVTGGDAGYFPLVDELCASIRSFRDAQAVALACIDGGMTGEQKAHLAARWGASILEVGWGFDIAPRRTAKRPALKVLTARTFLDQHLPEAETILWMDGDTWVQDPAALDLMFKGGETGRLAVVSQSSRYAQKAMSLRWAGLGYAQVRSILYKGARRARLPERLARQVGDKPTFNAGVFALNRDAPHWEAWRRRQAECLVHGRVFTSDQLALGIIVHADGLPAELMPETCNYMGPDWMASADGARLVERYLPNAPVGIVHMAGYDAMRLDAGLTIEIPMLGGGEVRRSLRRPAWAG